MLSFLHQHQCVIQPKKKRVVTPKTPKRKHYATGRKASSVSPGRKIKKGTMESLTPNSRPHGKTAAKIFRLKLATENAFPKDAELTRLVLDCLKKGLSSNQDIEHVTKRYKTDPVYAALLTDVVSDNYNHI